MDLFNRPTRPDRTLSVQTSARTTLTRVMAGAICCLLLACVSKSPPPAPPNRCPPNRPACQVEVVFTDVGLGERLARLEGRLSGEQPNATYLFESAVGERLRMKYSGPAIRLTLTRPGGQVDGPGLPPEMVLTAKGRYTLRVTANTMGDESFGDFVLEMRLIHAP
jgi:hypothetical protein